MPEITPIDVWGGTRNNWTSMTLPAERIWVHHSVTTPSGNAFADFQTLNRIGQTNGHGGISYSFAIHPDGTIAEGQNTRRGAHTGGQGGCNGSPWGWNPCSFGICFVGNYMNDELTPAAIESFKWLRDDLVARDLLVVEPPIDGHRHAPGNSTACPGDNIINSLDALRAASSSAQIHKLENDMVIAWGQTVFGVAISFLVSGGRVLQVFDGPVGAYGIPQKALDWKSGPGREAVALVLCDPDTIGKLASPWPTVSGGQAPAVGLTDADKDDIARRVADIIASRMKA